MSKWISKNRRLSIYKKHNHKCYYCGQSFNNTNDTLDHLIPRQRGGNNSDENLVASCRTCNSKKGLKTV